MDREVLDLCVGVIESIEQPTQGRQARVARHLEDELVFVVNRAIDQRLGSTQRRRVGELKAEVATWDSALELGGTTLGDNPSAVQYRDLVCEVVGLVEVLRGEEDRHPFATSSRMISHIVRRLRGSSPVVGSSRKITLGRPTNVMARSRRRRMPPE